eukprot:NODE_134_length_18141_cov_0.186066.p8 type:complete len:184 gc:universal NODE_134_length_18141_cov_0.186066:7875-8426(+)
MKRFIVIGLFIVIMILWFYKQGSPNFAGNLGHAESDKPQMAVNIPSVQMRDIFDMEAYIRKPVEIDNKDVMMPYLGNQTQRAELGHSTWHFLHTLAARYPVDPNNEQKSALVDFIHLFSKLYPCGNCASHFQLLIKEDPPLVSSRDDIVMWFCRQHNKVNVRLKKALFDCSSVYERWKCGCVE